MFESAGYSTVAPSWPDDPDRVAQARQHPEVFAGKGIVAITTHIAEVISKLNNKPAIVGHSFGGLITQKLSGMGLGRVAVAIDPAPFKGVLPLPLSTLKSSLPVLGNPANKGKAIALIRSVPIRLDERPHREGIERALRHLPCCRPGQAALPGRPCQLLLHQRSDRGHQEPRPRAPQDHLGSEGQHRPLGDR
ncbi:alpha/beta hydrolase [Rhodococcus sp. NPDC057135]|uniref:alpha/beta hydrolase n=1 Tax=Rhodococcus sp. NPDC057135 TaxID=3346028 RepID=UPI003624B198